MRLRRPVLAALAAVTLAGLLLPATAASASPPPAPSASEPSTAPAASETASKARPTHLRPTLTARARLSADFLAPGPPSGAQASPGNGRTGPFAGQVIPGFSGMIDNGDGSFWAMPDNGFGAKTNSADFLLRLYQVRPDWETGRVSVGRFVSLRDPNHRAGFPIVNSSTADRLLTGADFDIESIVRLKDGTFWIGEEFGPFLLHVDATGKLLQAPVPFVGGKSPQNPFLEAGETARVNASRGFEAMALSENGRYLYPIVEGSFAGETQLRRRYVYEFDLRNNRYSGRTWTYQTDQDANVIGDAHMTGRSTMLVIERDDFEGPASVTKRVYEIDLDRTDRAGYVTKNLVLDALRIANPDLVGSGTGYGTGDPFSFPVQSFETVVPLGKNRLLIANDNNYPGNAARNPGSPDDTELAVIDLERVRSAPVDATVVGHRGASGYRPEHTLASYETAIVQCADYIEPDLVSTKDGVLVARHENEIGGTTDVAAHPEFADRRTTKTIDGVALTGWFTEDLTLAELKTLRAKERIPATRPANTVFDGKYQIPTLDEVLDLARHSTTCDGRPVGVYPETKHPTWFRSIGLPLEEALVAGLRADGLNTRKSPVIIQSFETGNLKALAKMTPVHLSQLINCTGAPWDLVAAGDPRSYADLVTRSGLRAIARYADGIGPCKDVLIPRRADGTLGRPTAVIADAHRAGLVVHGFTFRRENQFLPADFRIGNDPNATGNLTGEIRAYLRAGMDGFFTDNPDIGVAAR